MADDLKTDGVDIATTDTTIYDPVTQSVVKSLFLRNKTAGPIVVDIALDGTPATAANLLFENVSVPANKTIELLGGAPLPLAATQSIHAIAATGSTGDVKAWVGRDELS